MKKSIAFFFLAVILLNVAGYYLVIEGWKMHHNASWSLEETTVPGQELILEIPLEVPYATQDHDWESSAGQFEYHGETYRIIKQKVTLNSVLIACVKDSESNRINDQLEDFVKSFTDKPSNGKQEAKAFSGFIKEYVSPIIRLNPSVSGWSLEVAQVNYSNDLTPSFVASIINPPESRA
ncbi:MAG: hypothetical protein U0289_08250 [Cyclobacteriaceae bacterium]|jgi:hypothetical protein|nr:hypothetical protein [Cyclobacteriaceae bacterium]HQQ83953.1 hypothetical protein [Cyclobacteriaceae bacterium]